jgi:hypothetical protein
MAQLGACAAAIVALENVAPGVQGTTFGNIGAVKALRDPEALQGLSVLTEGELLGKSTDTVATVERTAAGLPKVRIRHYGNINAASVTTPTCAADPAAAPIEDTFTLTKYLQQSFSFSVDRAKSLCGDAARIVTNSRGMRASVPNTPVMNELATILRMHARKLVQDLDKDVLLRLKSAFGVNARSTNTTAQNIELYKADGTRTSAGIDQLMADYRFNEGIGRPIILGGNRIVSFFESLGYGCCSLDGVDYNKINAINPYRIYFDPLVDDATAGFGANQFAVISAGAHKLVTANRYTINGVQIQRMANTSYGRVTFDELPGLQFDLAVDESGCVTPGWLFILSLSYEVFVPPAPMGAGDPLNGVNGMFRYTATQAA